MAVLFWVLRVRYWATTFELPFSDMADFERVARNILNQGSFAFTPFWQSYKPPVLPLLRAAQVSLFGEALLPWRILQSALVFTGMAWLAFEILRATRRFALAWIFALAVAMNKASIFWSLKVATEGVAEAFLYLSVAAVMSALRRPTLLRAAGAGAVLTVASLNRPNMMLALPLFLLALFVTDLRCRRASSPASARSAVFAGALRRTAVCLLACMLVWAPWLIRTYRLYGAVVPFNTSGALSFIYGVWVIDVPWPDGRWVSEDYPTILKSAPQRFRNDYEFDQWGKRAVRRWVARRWPELLTLIPQRAVETVRDRDVQLTKVSRVQLFPGPLNRLLLDKSTFTVAAGILGLVALPLIVDRRLAWLGLFAIPAWASTLPLQNNCRLLEPSLPIFLFGCVAWPYAALRIPWIAVTSSAVRRSWPVAVRVQTPRIGAATAFAVSVFALAAPQPATASGARVPIRNPGLEQWTPELPVGWALGGAPGTVVADQERPRTGRRCALVAPEDRAVALYQDIPAPRMVEGKDFALAAWVRSPNANSVHLTVSDSRRWYVGEYYRGSGGWERLQIRGVAADTIENFRIHAVVDRGPACVDDVTLELWAEPSGVRVRELVVRSLSPDGDVYLFAVEDAWGDRIEFEGGRISGRGEVYQHPDQGVRCVRLSGPASYQQRVVAEGSVELLFYRLPTGGTARVEFGGESREIDLRTPVPAGEWTRIVLPSS